MLGLIESVEQWRKRRCQSVVSCSSVIRVGMVACVFTIPFCDAICLPTGTDRLTLEQRTPSHPIPSKESSFGEAVDIELGGPYATELGLGGFEPYNDEAGAGTGKANAGGATTTTTTTTTTDGASNENKTGGENSNSNKNKKKKKKRKKK